MATRIRRNHLGVGFEIWTDKWTWFWSLSDPHERAGAVGATASGADAIDEARLAIEELLQRSGRGASSSGPVRFRKAPRHGLSLSESWGGRLDRSAEYLAGIRRQFAAV